MRGAVVLLRQLFLPLCHFSGETNDHVVFIGLSVNRDGAECSAFDLHRLTPSFSARGPDSVSADRSGRALLPRLPTGVVLGGCYLPPYEARLRKIGCPRLLP